MLTKLAGAKRTVSTLVVGSLAFLTTFVLIYLMVLTGPWASVKVDLVLTSTASGSSQLFVAASNEVFSEVQSDVVPINQGTNAISFRLSLPRTWDTAQIRWDPLDQPANILLTDATLQVGFNKTHLGGSDFRASVDISEVQVSGDTVSFSTLSNDGQILIINEDAQSIDRFRITALVAGLTGAAVLMIFILLCSRCAENVRRFVGLTHKFAVFGCNLQTASLGAMLATGIFLFSWFWQI